MAWNEGNIPKFMEWYVKDDSLRFASKDQVRRGWQETLWRYQTDYPIRAAMGQLRLEDLEIRVLSSRSAEVFGRFRLKRGGAYQDLSGLFTLLMTKENVGWKILHDHTSAGS